MRLLHEIAIFQTVKSKVIISLFETVRLSVSISLRNLYNSLNSMKETIFHIPENTISASEFAFGTSFHSEVFKGDTNQILINHGSRFSFLEL